MIQGDPGARLSVTISNGMTVEVRLGQKEVKIGRGHEADLQLPDRSVSRLHAKVFRVGRQYFLADLRSRNGTHADGKRVTQLALENGRMFQVGRSGSTFNARLRAPSEKSRRLPRGRRPPSPVPPTRNRLASEAGGSAHNHRRGAVWPDRRIGPCPETGRDDPPRRRVRRAGPDRGETGSGRNWWHGDPRRLRAPGAPVHRRHTAGRSLPSSSKASCSDMRRERSPEPPRSERGVRTRQQRDNIPR